MVKVKSSLIKTISGNLSCDLYYAMPRVAIASLYAPMNVVQGIYTKHYGLALTSIAAVILFARLLDAVTDPLIGYLSDKYRLKHGTRKPFMVLGALIMIGSGYFLYSPPDNVTILYFGFWFVALFIGLTLFEIPHLAWGGEIVHDTHAKTQTYNFRTAAAFSGLVLFYSLPLLPIWDSSDITPETLHFSAIVSGMVMLPLLYLCMKKVPNGSCYAEAQKSDRVDDRLGSTDTSAFRDTVNSVIYNRPLKLFLSAFLFAGFGLGMWLGLLFIFVDAYLGMGADFSEVFLLSLIIGVMGSLLWIYIAKHIGKKNAWIVAMILGIASFFYTGLLSPENANYWSILILLIINTLCFVCVESLPQSMLSDIVDYSTLKFRVYRGSTYFSLFLFTYKGAFAIGGALGLALAGWYGFNPASSTHTDTSIDGLKMAMTWLPILFSAVSLIFIACSPITTKRHHIIRKRLDALESRSIRQKTAYDAQAKASKLSLMPSNS